MKFWNLKSGYDMQVILFPDFRLISGEDSYTLHSKSQPFGVFKNDATYEKIS